jgi:hypothetical protein
MATSDRVFSPCGDSPQPPRRPDNRAGLPQIAYRITTQPEAFARMLAGLPRIGLRTRDPADPTISLIDAVAMACDILSFYSERVANEGFLATATQRRSVLELARMIGYRLAPGVASSTHLAFSVEAADDPYRVVQIDAGVQAMAIPHDQGKLPQMFETVEAITARAEWNEIHARTVRPQNLVLFHNLADETDGRNGTLYLFDLDNSFTSGALADPALVTITSPPELTNFHPLSRRFNLADALASRIEDHASSPSIVKALYALPVDEVCLNGLGLNLRPGMRILAVGKAAAAGASVVAMPLRVVTVREDRGFGLTKVVLTRSGSAPEAVRRAPPLQLPILRFGVMPPSLIPLGTQVVESLIRGRSWSGDGLSALVQSQAWQRTKLMTLMHHIIRPLPEAHDVAHPDTLGLHVMRESAGFFGAAAPRHDTLSYGTVAGTMNKGPYTHNWDGDGPGGGSPNTIWMDALAEPLSENGEAQVYLDREIRDLPSNGWAILENGAGGSLGLRVTHAAVQSRADYAITGKTTQLSLRTASDQPIAVDSPASPSIYNSFLFRTSQIHALSELLPLAGVPLTAELPQGSSSLELDRLYLDLERGRPVSLSGARSDAEGITGRETQLIQEVQHIDGITRLLFQGGTSHPYQRTTVRLNANVALATHGETVQEDLGSGDGRLTFQSFPLKKSPLTYVSAASETGRASTLKIRVNGQLWQETPALGQAGPTEAVYEVLQTDDGTTHVRFGDGRTGRRLPSGLSNVTATYRSGIGFAGEVPEEAISQLRSRPLGVRAVLNPSPASGAADPETLAMARHTAPGTVKTLGRIVSLRDHADFALAFAGVGKAQVRQLWAGQQKVVHLTIAPEADAELRQSDPLFSNLADSIRKVRDPGCRLVIQPYQRRYFAMTARITTDPSYRSDDVIQRARQAIESHFGYLGRGLAQPVSAAEVIAALQATPGVLAVDLDALALLLDGGVPDPTGSTLQTLLPALPARGPGQRGQEGDPFSAAELLLVLPAAIILIPVESLDA